ncbi:MAG: adenosine kinase [Bacteroidales bacterium]|jgi:sugar/nucleoside kinase (ribokinase family)|nr:adenosine kinase [Bacteroidales bacterium]
MTKIIGLGNALVDITIPLPDDGWLKDFKLPKGSMQHVERSIIDKLLEKTAAFNQQITSGGSAANTIHGLAHLGNSTAFIGKTGKDRLGTIFHNDLINSSINPHLIISETETGTAIAFVTPDSERTFAVFLGAALELEPSDLKQEIFTGYDYLHIEGYMVQNHKLIENAFILAKNSGLKISLDLASYNVVEENLDFLNNMIGKYVDVIFANEEEAQAFTGLSPEPALAHLAGICEIAVVKTGARGSMIRSGNETHHIDIIPVNVVDTTGAGDLYAAGFLHGLAQGLSLDKSGKAGALLSGNVIQYFGAKVPAESWTNIKNEIKKL